MNKKFTMVCASLLLASAFSVNAAIPAEELRSPIVVEETSVSEVVEGFQFYLGTTTNSLYQVKKNNDKQTILGDITNEVSKAAIFEIRNLKKVGADKAQFELYVNGSKVYTGKASSYYVNLVNSKFTPDRLGYIRTVEFASLGDEFASGASAFTTSLTYRAADLKDVNKNGTTFSFDFSDNELVGNLFKELTPVTVDTVTYFLKGEKAKELKGFTVEDIKGKGIQILAIDNKNNYALNSSKPGEGLKLRMVDAEKFLMYKDNVTTTDKFNQTDSLSLAGFTSIVEADQLNNAEVLSLNVKPTENALGIDVNNNKNDNLQVDFKIAAVKTSATDTKAYVTTVAEASSWAVVKDAMLGDNTYLAASDFLKADAINTVSILIVNGKPGADKYYNYVISKNASTVAYRAASKLDFEMAQNQWVVTNFDGKYTVTLKNRLSDQVLTLRLAKTEAGYEVRSGLDQVLNEKNESVNAVIKFLGVETTATDGYLKLTDEQIEKGIKLSFSGETVLAGEKEFFGVYNEDKNAMIPSFKADNSVVFYAVPNVDDKKADKVAKDLTYACLNDKGEVVYKTAEDNLVVPTYILATEFAQDGKVAKALGSGYAIENTATPSVVFAFAKNMNGTYSLTSQASTTTDVKTYAAGAIVGVQYNKGSQTNLDGLEYTTIDRYDAYNVNNVFANVNILPNAVLNPSFPAQSGHFTFDNERGSINVTDIKGINEGALSSEGMVFWLDSADTELDTPSFYISYGVKGEEAARQYMFNPADSAKVFNTNTAKYDYNEVYFYGEDATAKDNGTLKAAFTAATQEEGKDLANQFKFNITLVDNSDEYILTTVSKGLNGETLAVAQKNGVVILVNKDDKNAEVKPMTFAVNPADAPTSNEGVSTSEVAVVANNGSVVVKNAAGKNVVVSTILGQVVANEVLTSDNATINVPASIVVVSVDGESFKVNVR